MLKDIISVKEEFLERREYILYNTKENKQKAILASVDTGVFDAENSMCELEELAKTAGAEAVAQIVQKMPKVNSGTYFGEGKLSEIQKAARLLDAELLIVDDELSGVQLRNIEERTGLDVIDRTMLILDIFAQHARSNEGKVQVELAQQKYLLPRLSGIGKRLSRQGGGIGTRGPGETKLESDRRHIRRRIETLSQELTLLSKRREDRRQRRKKNKIPLFALVGYTNAGKSTLLNALTGANVYTKNQLFATLDPMARELILPSGQKVILVDTVGVLRRLPHQLISAFESTLEEAVQADYILHVCDLSNPDTAEQKQVAENLLYSIGGADIPTVTVYNKCDLVPPAMRPRAAKGVVCVSAKTGEGMDLLLAQMETFLSERMIPLDLMLPYSEGALLSAIRQNGQIHSLVYTDFGTQISASVPRAMTARLSPYLKKELL